MNAFVISIDADGTAHCLHTDALPLQELGTLDVQRASTVEFNAALQQWEVRWPRQSPNDPPAYANKYRADCLAWEVETLTQALALTGSACPAQ